MTGAHTEALKHADQPNLVDQEESEEEDYEDDGDDDIDAEAEAIARRLGEELWADISKAKADRAGEIHKLQNTTIGTIVSTGEGSIFPTLLSNTSPTVNGDAVIATIKVILKIIQNDSLARRTLASTPISNSNGDNILDTFNLIVTSGNVPKRIAMPLSQTLVFLARSRVLFGSLRHSNASSIQLDRGKRKREEGDEGPEQKDFRVTKRPYTPGSDIQVHITDAVRVIMLALGASSTRSPDPVLVSSIRFQLHQVFLFAVTSSPGVGREMHALQEIGGLIQVIGVLSGIQIGQPPDAHPQQLQPPHFPSNPTYQWSPGQSPSVTTDIGTAVYPCLVANCRKTFSRLYSLRAHQRVHAAHRPFRCNVCPASFARNHDLKRHIKLHDRKAWKCGGCLKVFSRRDAIKRHKNSSKTRGPKSDVCLEAEVVEVDLNEDGEDSIREERRAKLWNGIAISQTGSVSVPRSSYGGSHFEEGEIQPSVISEIQSTVMKLHEPLQGYVGNVLGMPSSQSLSHPMDPKRSQATLASVIARAQLHNMSPKIVSATEPVVNQSVILPDLSNSTLQPPQGSLTSDGLLLDNHATATVPSLSMYGLSDEQTKLLEKAIANAASAAQAQAEAEAALEEAGEELDQEDEDYDGSEDHLDGESSL